VANAKRVVVTVRVPPALVKKLDALVQRRQRELGTANFSRNDAIVALIQAATKEKSRD
jgi:hypothetical protein